MEPKWLPFGVLRRPHGVHGEILLSPYNGQGDGAWATEVPAEVRWSKGERTLVTQIVAMRKVANGWLVRLGDAASREAVAALVGGEIQLPRQRLPHLHGGEFFVEDLVGCEAWLADGRRVGVVKGSFWNGVHDVMAIVGEDGDERFLPVLPGFVLDFDAEARRLTVDLHE